MEKLIQISSGRGPIECEWVVGQVAKLFIDKCDDNDAEAELINKVIGDEKNTFKSISIYCKGKDLSFINEWIGSIQYVGKSKFRKFHKRNNYFINVQYIATKNEMSKLNESDVSFQVFRSSGPGGQHVNKVSTAVRAIHKPTKIFAESQSQRSQSQNKKQAMQKLQIKLMLNYKKNLKKDQQNNWMQHNLLVRGNAVKTFKDFPLVEVA